MLEVLELLKMFLFIPCKSEKWSETATQVCSVGILTKTCPFYIRTSYFGYSRPLHFIQVNFSCRDNQSESFKPRPIFFSSVRFHKTSLYCCLSSWFHFVLLEALKYCIAANHTDDLTAKRKWSILDHRILEWSWFWGHLNTVIKCELKFTYILCQGHYFLPPSNFIPKPTWKKLLKFFDISAIVIYDDGGHALNPSSQLMCCDQCWACSFYLTQVSVISQLLFPHWLLITWLNVLDDGVS